MEIERKYLVKRLPENLSNFKKSEIKQAYISFSPTIRVRQSGNQFYLTCKGEGNLAR